ncbi:hypothetical protein [Luteimonas fraxinea]|jgi:hypothetical protein|uniref:hypothetical protein n=1 Tax=Luteimonas fraxinea TaxID=2901869 RepID=UPI001E3B0435|nr:hypothetical protein [Luteimonas fraxinea]MCD9124832.1 hypothetical protein [Luteimonas fraxinea]
MFRIHAIRSADTFVPVPACVAQPARFHAQVRAARSHADSPFRVEVRDSAMPTRFHIV